MKKLVAVLSFIVVLAVSITVFAEDINLTTVMPTILRAKKGAIGNKWFGSVAPDGIPNADIPASSLLVEGKVGIGTKAPGEKLHIFDGNISVETSSLADLGLRFRHTGGGPYASIFRETATGKFIIRNDQGLPIILDNGSVGIGTVSPAYPLDVAADASGNAAAFHGFVYFGPDAMGELTTKIGTDLGAAGNTDKEAILTLRNGIGQGANDEIWIGPNTATTMGYIHLSATYIYDGQTPPARILGTYSDISLKKDIVTIPNALDRVCALRGVNFHWKNKNSHQSLQMGVVAQEVEKIFPEVVFDEPDGKKNVAYPYLIGALIEAIKDQQKEIKSQGQEIASLKSDLAELKAR